MDWITTVGSKILTIYLSVKDRRSILLLIAFLCVGFALLFTCYGYEKTWRLWNIPVMRPIFADMRAVIAACESHAQGLDPMLSNPNDPWKRRINLPSLTWKWVCITGAHQEDVVWIGIGAIASFLIGVYLISPRLHWFQSLLMVAVLISPATLLGIERANLDLLLFFMVSLSVILITRFPLLSMFFLIVGFALKLFPIFGYPLFLRLKKSKLVLLTALMIPLLAFYAFANRNELQTAYINTPHAIEVSYGFSFRLLPLLAERTSVAFAVAIPFFLFFVLLVSIILLLFVESKLAIPVVPSLYLDSFRAGAGIFLGTALFTRNFDYRLIFLILTIPQLAIWVRSQPRLLAQISLVALVGIYFSTWEMLLSESLANGCHRYIGHAFLCDRISVLFNEISTYAALVGLSWLLVLSSPPWLKEGARKLILQIRKEGRRSNV